MKVMSNANQVPLDADPQRLTIMLPAGQDIQAMSFTKEQQNAAATKRRMQTRDAASRLKRKPTLESFTHRTVRSMTSLPQHNDNSRPGSSNARPCSKSNSRKLLTDESQELHWQDMEIPSELEAVHADTPEEIRNIVQESMDEHRAMRASRISQPQAIVVRTTITQSRTSDEDGIRPVLTESSASASSRRAESSLSGDMSSARSVGIQSTTSLGSSEGDNESLKLPTTYNNASSTTSEEDLSANTGIRAILRRGREKPLRDRGVFKYLRSRKGKETDSGEWDGDGMKASECTSCSDDLPTEKTVSLACRHKYCTQCFSQLVLTSIRSESTFPPKCCFQEIAWKTMRAHLSADHLALCDEKALEYAVGVGNRYYCAAPNCAKWIDVRSARAYGGALRCPHCGSSVCRMCRGQAHGKEQDCPNDIGLNFTLQQAERAGGQGCYNCRAVVELNTGCRHITCKCQAEFWYNQLSEN